MNFIQEHFITILSTIFGGGTFTAYLFERNKNKAVTKGVEADADSKEIDNSSKIITQYKEALEDLPARYELKYQEMSKLWDKKVTMLLDEIAQLENSYQRKTKLLEDEIKLKNKFISSLKREIRERDNEIKRLREQAGK
jgi:predicted RNase H-like nuclease (RuvC/YqgF family)